MPHAEGPVITKRGCATRGEPCEPKRAGFCCRNDKHKDLECRQGKGKVYACWSPAKKASRYEEEEEESGKPVTIDAPSVDKREEDEKAAPEEPLQRRQFNCQPQGRKCDPSKPNKCCSPNDCDKKRKVCRPHWDIVEEEMRDWRGRSEEPLGEEEEGEEQFIPDTEVEKR
jgi:hypothetical protein